MRVGAFLLGGIAGAAAVIYLNRITKSMIFSAFSSSNDSMGKMMNKAKNTFAGDSNNQTSKNPQKDHLDQAAKSAKQDPALQHNVNEILSKAEGNNARIQ
jgi:hypothetical protein